MKLIKYRVTNFRSVKDSGWIDAGNVTALIGVNESGKTNLLIPLWKMNPAQEGELQPTADYPKRMFGEIREKPSDYQFISAEFSTEELAGELATLTGLAIEKVAVVQVQRYYDGRFEVIFPEYVPSASIPAQNVRKAFENLETLAREIEPLKQEEGLKAALLIEAQKLVTYSDSDWDVSRLVSAAEALKSIIPEHPAKTSMLVPRATQTLETIDGWLAELRRPKPEEVNGVKQQLVKALPKFVYYSNYGNLDSEIYLPHVVQNLKRADLGAKEAAKARTLKVLFSFVRLQPTEILALGQDFRDLNRQPTATEIEAIAEKKRQRSILLQSASTLLTQQFKAWWKQGDYRFRFEADGDHFRIWVSDDRRPEEVELESRSTGLQWFLSFYLVFLVESQADHENAVLLLDEPGLSLHPLAQRDLSKFFDGLTQTNQIIYTTHSPFLVDADRLDRVRKVLVAADGSTQCSSNLRQSGADAAQAGAAYAVYSALNLSVAESLLLGCSPIIVEGASDQHYLTMFKALLIGAGKISPGRELVFPPAGGTKTLRPIASILTGRDDRLPVVLLDGDEMGTKMAKELGTSLYQDAKDKVLSTDDFVGFKGSELEDLVPQRWLAQAIDRLYRDSDQSFGDIVEDGLPIVSQIERWAQKEGVELSLGWKVEVAKRVKQIALAKGISEIDPNLVERWVKLFNSFARFAD